MKNGIALKTFLLVVVFSISASLYIIGCEEENKKSINALREEVGTSYVNLQNPNGSVTPVKIKRVGNVYVGPRGEQYNSYPTVDQLQPVYGTK